jgi:peptidyl-prolyl cis-trans isomerase SurA
MTKITTAIAGLALGLAGTQLASAQTRELGSSGELLDGIAALVDTGIVLKSELGNRLDTVASNFVQQQMQLPPEQRGQLPPRSVLEDQVLDELIVEEIQVQRADAIGIVIGDDVLNQVLAEYAATLGTTLGELPAFVESQGQGYQAFREEWRRDLKIRQLERVQVVERIAINERALGQCLEQVAAAAVGNFEYNISHILLGFSLDATPEAIAAVEDQAREISRQLDEGADFAQLAVEHSESQTALEGGALGWRRGAEMPPVFAADALEMDVGEHSTPIRGNGGFHIVRLNDKRGGEPQLVDQLRLRHILLSPTEVLDDDATRQKMQGIRDQILAGDDFAAIAAAVSEDALSGVDGGDLGWSTLDDFVPEFSSVLSALEIGEVSEPFRTPYGWHIAEVTDRRSHDVTQELQENQCRSQIGNRRLVEEREIWRRRLRDEAYVDKRL